MHIKENIQKPRDGSVQKCPPSYPGTRQYRDCTVVYSEFQQPGLSETTAENICPIISSWSMVSTRSRSVTTVNKHVRTTENSVESYREPGNYCKVLACRLLDLCCGIICWGFVLPTVEHRWGVGKAVSHSSTHNSPRQTDRQTDPRRVASVGNLNWNKTNTLVLTPQFVLSHMQYELARFTAVSLC